MYYIYYDVCMIFIVTIKCICHMRSRIYSEVFFWYLQLVRN